MNSGYAPHEPFSDAALRAAAQLVRESMLRVLEEKEPEEHSFTEAFLEKIRKLVVIDRRRMRTRVFYQRVAGIILGILIGSGFFLAFNPEARADFLNWVRTTYENSILYEFFQGAKKEEATLPEIEFTWLPGEYEIQEVFNDGHSKTIILSADDDTMVLKCWVGEELSHIEIFTDDYIQTETEVNGRKADYFQPNDPETAGVLIWTESDDEYILYLLAEHPQEIMNKIAEKIMLK